MRSKLARAVVGAILSVVVTVPIGARPAAAVDIKTVIEVVKGLYDLYKAFTASHLTLEQATSQIITAVNTAKTDILAQVDRVATAQARACTRSAVIDFADIQAFTPDTLQAYARDATACATLIDSLLDVVTDKASADALGFALDTVGPLALAARSRAGLSTPALIGTLIDANNVVISSLAPTCTVQLSGVGPAGPLPGNWYVFITTCVAYNGDRAVVTNPVLWPPTSNPVDIPAVSALATKNTSRAAATYVVPVLQSMSG
jgi:hypothetical protein